MVKGPTPSLLGRNPVQRAELTVAEIDLFTRGRIESLAGQFIDRRTEFHLGATVFSEFGVELLSRRLSSLAEGSSLFLGVVFPG
jgi:hypothetical protein